jgi:hypothetical protein
MKNINEAQILNRWSPIIEKATGMTDKGKLNWVSKYAHYHALNEAAMGGVSAPYSTLYTVPGVGTAMPASAAATSGAQFQGSAVKGSGDKWPALLPMALQVAARTVGFDVVNVIPMPGPTGVVSYLDYVYAGGRQPFGAQPGNITTQNPNSAIGTGNTAASLAGAPHAFKINLDSSVKTLLPDSSVGQTVYFSNDSSITVAGPYMSATYIGKSRIDGFPMFKTGTFVGTTNSNLADIFDGVGSIMIGGTVTALKTNADCMGVTGKYPTLISTLEDQVQGFTGAGTADTDNWAGTFVSGTTLYEPMERGVGEMVYPRALGLQVFTKFVQVGTYQVSVSVTQEQIQDLNKQWGIDVIAMVENAGINEISQSINKHILSRLFAHGWKNHINANTVESINLNLNCASTGSITSTAYAYNNSTDAGVGQTTTTAMTVPGFASYAVSAAGSTFENQSTIIQRVVANILAAGNVIAQRGRRGPANFVITNLKIATALQTNAQYTFAPITNTFNQTNGSLYPVGTVAGMTVYVDPNMIYTDTRVLVGRKGAADEPGVVFCPYLMAESVKLITEGTGAPKVIIKTRYALVDAGFHPETQYLTLFINTNSGNII